MGFYNFPGVGMVHLNEAAPRRVVPGAERHRWNCKPGWGESAFCLKCGCEKLRKKPEYEEFYRLPGSAELLPQRPACTTAPQQAAALLSP